MLGRSEPSPEPGDPDADLPTLDRVDLRAYDFLDFGAGVGRSLDFCTERLGGRRGLGIEINEDKVRKAQDLGREVVLGDILALPDDCRVRFVSMMDFLEHLRTPKKVERILDVAVRCAEDFLFIRHPSFEDEAYLGELGLRQYWHDWGGHPSHLLLSDFARILDKLGVHAWSVRFRKPIRSSDDPTIIPLGAPRNQLAYDPETCGPKPSIEFAKPVHRMLDILVCLSPAGFDAAPQLLEAAKPGRKR